LSTFSTAYEPQATIIFNKQLKETKNLPDKIIDIADFIEVKGMKAQGNQLTKYKVKEVLLNHDIQNMDKPWPQDEKVEAIIENVSNEPVKTNKDSEKANRKVKEVKKKSTTVKAENSKVIINKGESKKKTATNKTKEVEDTSNTIEWDLTDKGADDDDQMTLF